MPARHRHHHSSERPKTFTMMLDTAFTNEPEYAFLGKH
jgi:hypothetical protein